MPLLLQTIYFGSPKKICGTKTCKQPVGVAYPNPTSTSDDGQLNKRRCSSTCRKHRLLLKLLRKEYRMDYLAEFVCGKEGCTAKVSVTDTDQGEAKFQARFAWQQHLQADHSMSFGDAQMAAANRKVPTQKVEVL
jgi:hypothetical protein